MRSRSLVALAIAAVPLSLALAPSTAAANLAPVCASDSYAVVAGESIDVDVHCTDPDGPNPIPQYSYEILAWPSHGEITFPPPGQPGLSHYFAWIGYSGSDTFSYRATDGIDWSAPGTLDINILPGLSNNLPPVCPTTQAFVAPGGSIDVYGTCVDPEGDPVRYGPVAWPTGGSYLILGSPPDAIRYAPFPGTQSDTLVYSGTDGKHPPVESRVDFTITSGNVFQSASEATPSDPFIASVTSPLGGPVAIATRALTSPPPAGYVLFGQEFAIQAPATNDPGNPLTLVFAIDGSQAPTGQVDVFRDLATNPDPIPDCTAGPGTANPDPCVLSRTGEAPNDVQVTVLTSRASTWNLGVSRAYPFSGFLEPVNNLPTLNSVNAGRAIPVNFSLGGDRGLGIMAPGYPKSQTVACDSNAPVDGIESTVTAGGSSLEYDAGTDRYTYVWKTDKEWAGTCRQLVVKLADGTSHRASFLFR